MHLLTISRLMNLYSSIFLMLFINWSNLISPLTNLDSIKLALYSHALAELT